jgi:hypothetical protein
MAKRDASKPYWFPDTRGFLGGSMVLLIGFIVAMLIAAPPQIDERTSGVLMTIVGVLLACLKDVYGFAFGSSAGEKETKETISKIALEPSPPQMLAPPAAKKP